MIALRLAAGALVALVLVACASERNSPGSPSGDARSAGDASVGRPPPTEWHCEHFSLRFGPVTLPAAVPGAPYEVRLLDYADHGWRGLKYSAYMLPPGLALSKGDEAPMLRGIPTTRGGFDFTVTAVHGLDANGCSTMPDPHTFHLDISDGDGGLDAGGD